MLNFFRANFALRSCAQTRHLPSRSSRPAPLGFNGLAAFIVALLILWSVVPMKHTFGRDEDGHFAFPCKRARYDGSYATNCKEESKSVKTEPPNPFPSCPMTSESAGCSWVTWKPREPWYTKAWPCNMNRENKDGVAQRSVLQTRCICDSLKAYGRLVLGLSVEDVSSLRHGRTTLIHRTTM